MPAAGVIVGSSFGLNGIWIAMGLGSFFGAVAMSAAILVKRGRHGFPLLLPRRRETKIRMFDLVLTEDEVVRTSKQVAAALPDEIAQRAALMVEEVFMTVRGRNEGGVEQNIRAAVKYLVRKGFSRSGKPVRVVSRQEFWDWATALENCNSRTVLTVSGKKYCVEYADLIIDRAENCNRHVGIEIGIKK